MFGFWKQYYRHPSHPRTISSARLWKNYKTDYKPLVDFAKEKKINFNTYQIWLLSMLNNEELWEQSQQIAITLNDYSLSDKNAKKVKSQEVNNLLASVNKKQFIEGLTSIVKGSDNSELLTSIAEVVHSMPVDNVPYFLTLIRFHYAVVNK